MKEQKNSKVLIVVSMTLHALLSKLSNRQDQWGKRHFVSKGRSGIKCMKQFEHAGFAAAQA